MQSNTIPGGPCQFCSTGSVWITHDGPCPRVKAIEYHPDGTVKRIEFVTAPPLAADTFKGTMY